MIVHTNIVELSRHLKEKLKDDSSNYAENTQLVDLVDDLLLVWSQKDASLYSQILKINEKDHSEAYKPQILSLSRPPIWNVTQIRLNKSGTGVLLVGDKGLAIVELPKRWGNPSLFQGGIEHLICRIEYVGEQFLTGNPKLCVRSAIWHPGSLDHSHIIVLTSDDYLRIYNLSYLEIPEQALALSKSSRHLDGSKLLGETSIAFDFGTPIYPDNEKNSLNDMKQGHVEEILDEVEHRKKRHMELSWPLFILYSNGDVFYTITSLSRKRLGRTILYGPMTMYPKANDNYGLEFVSIVVLQSTPNVLVIGNSEGFLHHCIAIEASEQDMLQRETQNEDYDLSETVSQLTLEMPSLMLHVYESVHIMLSFTQEEASCVENTFSLLADPNTPARYWVIHKEGVHAVSVPVVDRLIQLAASPQDLTFADMDFPCSVSHIVCTRSSPSLPLLPVIGLGLTCSHVGILSNSAFVLLANGDIHIVSNSVIPQLEGVLSDYQNNNNKQSVQNSQHNSFESHVRRILNRDASQPLLLSGYKTELNPEDYLTLLGRVSSNLHENYMRPQIRCREEVQRRSSLLRDQKQGLERELKGVALEVKSLSNKAHKLAEDYEESKEKHESLVKRIERVQSRLACQLPILSSSEQTMFSTLQEINQTKCVLSAQVNQLQDKLKWQTLQMEKHKDNNSPTLTGNQLEHLKLTLSKENETLLSLKKKIKSAKVELNLK